MNATWRFRLRKLRTLNGREWRDLLAAQAALLRAQVLAWTRPKGSLVSAERAPMVPAPTEGTSDEALRLATAVVRAANHGVFRPKCLVRAVALHSMLEARGIPGSQVRVGVQMRNGRFFAHAWVEYQGQVLGDSARHVRSFAELSELQVLTAPPA